MFKSKSEKNVEELAQSLVAPLNSIDMAVGGLISADDLRTSLAEQSTRLGPLMRSMSTEDRLEAHRRYWLVERGVFESLIATGAATELDVTALQQEWIRTMELAVLHRPKPTP